MGFQTSRITSISFILIHKLWCQILSCCQLNPCGLLDQNDQESFFTPPVFMNTDVLSCIYDNPFLGNISLLLYDSHERKHWSTPLRSRWDWASCDVASPLITFHFLRSVYCTSDHSAKLTLCVVSGSYREKLTRVKPRISFVRDVFSNFIEGNGRIFFNLPYIIHTFP